MYISRSISIFSILIGYSIIGLRNAYEIPNLQTKLFNNRFRLSVPDESGIKMVFFVMEINQKCPAIMKYALEVEDNKWSIENTNLQLKDDDKIVVNVLVQFEDNIVKSMRYFNVVNKMLVPIPRPSENFKLTNKCDDENVLICVDAITEVQNQVSICRDELIYEEQFNELNLDRWTYDVRLGMSTFETAEFCLFDSVPENSYVKDGLLNIKPTVVETNIRKGNIDLGDRCTAINDGGLGLETSNLNNICNLTAVRFDVLPPVYSAQLHTKPAFSFKYGRVEIRAKLPQGDWLLPHLILQPISTQPETYHAPQMRIAFARGHAHYDNSSHIDVGGSRLFGGLVLWQNSENVLNRVQPRLREIKSTQHFGADFHIYTLTWTRESIKLAVDGQEYGEITENLNTFREKCYIMLGVSVGGHLWFEDTINTPKQWINTSPRSVFEFWSKRNEWKNTWTGAEVMQVDYVRVYAV